MNRGFQFLKGFLARFADQGKIRQLSRIFNFFGSATGKNFPSGIFIPLPTCKLISAVFGSNRLVGNPEIFFNPLKLIGKFGCAIFKIDNLGHKLSAPVFGLPSAGNNLTLVIFGLLESETGPSMFFDYIFYRQSVNLGQHCLDFGPYRSFILRQVQPNREKHKVNCF